jgi:hypothetical protein
MTGYETFALFHPLKLHFTTDYDYFKYNGKCNISMDAFERRKDKYHFYKLSRKYTNDEELKWFLIANLVDNDKLWVGDLLGDGAEQNFKRRQKTLQSLTYTFENDCRNIFDGVTDPNEMLRCKNGDYPPLLTKYLQRDVQVETICILSRILGLIDIWNACIAENIRWPTLRNTFTKYTPFLPQDVTPFKLKLKTIINE